MSLRLSDFSKADAATLLTNGDLRVYSVEKLQKLIRANFCWI
jgi:hypothetical protein